MCARVHVMYGTSFRDIIIRPGGPSVAAAELNVGDGVPVIDVRHKFPRDGRPDPGLTDWKKLVHLARLLRDQLIAGHKTVIVQCAAGQSRSVRTVGAFLMLFNGYKKGAAMGELKRAFTPAQRVPDCAQDMKEELVTTWLDTLQLICQANGEATVKEYTV